MEAYLFYSRQTAGERQMAQFADRLTARGVTVELIDADSERGTRLVEIYDLMARPVVAVVRDDGGLIQAWTDPEQLPSVEDVSYWAHL